MRGVAAEAGVDVALGHYYFGSKRELFAAALELPVNPADAIAGLLAHGTDDLAERLLRLLLQVWDDPQTGGPLQAHAALGRQPGGAAARLRRARDRGAAGDRDRRPRRGAARRPRRRRRSSGSSSRATSSGSQPIASAGHDEIVALIAPSLQRYFDPA